MKTKNIVIFLAAFITGFGVTLGASAQLKELDLFGDAIKAEITAPAASALVDEVYELDLELVRGVTPAGEAERVAEWAPAPYDN
jgi:hypothetical protein